MRLFTSLAILAVIAIFFPGLASTPREVINFSLSDHAGRNFEFRKVTSRALVLFFSMNGCPVARQTIPKLKEFAKQQGFENLEIWVVFPGLDDDRQKIREEHFSFWPNNLPFLKDDSQGLARFFGVERAGECIAIDMKARTVFYRGPVDDQASEGAVKPASSRNYLADALTAFFAGNPIPSQKPAVRGCLLTFEFEKEMAEDKISYARDIAPMMREHCATCHRPQNIGGFSFASYRSVQSRLNMIQEVILSKRMPPWHADPHHGTFSNDISLSAEERRKFLRWIEAGGPRGEGPDPLTVPLPEQPRWSLGEPDATVKLPAPETIPATGLVPYRRITIKNPFTNDVWLRSVVVAPQNKKVTHHVLVRLRKPDGKTMDDEHYFAVWVPGQESREFPHGTAKFLPSEYDLELEMHYTTSGTEQTDQTEIGLYLHPNPPRQALKAWMIHDLDIAIPPGSPDARAFASHYFKNEVTLYELFPHMHLRGSWFKYELYLPDGKRETLLSVPNYDFAWQTEYRLASPRVIPKGSWIICTGGFDNSPLNPANPNPRERVVFGEQTIEEMFIGFINVVETPPTLSSVSNRP